MRLPPLTAVPTYLSLVPCGATLTYPEPHSSDIAMAGVLLLRLLWLSAGAPKKAPKQIPGSWN